MSIRLPEPEESGTTFWENARIKALAYAQAVGTHLPSPKIPASKSTR